MNAYLKKKIISIAAPIITATGIHKVFERYYGGIGHVLTFHRIVPESKLKRVHNHLSLEITPEHLERIINFFRHKNYDFLSLDQLYEGYRKGTFPDKKFVVITFDDGYKDNLELAYPILKKYDIPFTVYVTTGIPNKTAILWWYILENMILERNEVRFSWKENNYCYTTKTSVEKEKAFELIQGFIHQNFNLDDYLELYGAVFKDFQSDLSLNSLNLGMNWDEIRRLNEDPLVTIGAHTVNHFNLSKLSQKDLRSEILESKIELEKQLGQPIMHFAYPYGKSRHASVREFACAESLGFKTATTNNIGNLFQEYGSMLYNLPRININRVTDKYVLKMQTSGLLPLIINKGKKNPSEVH